MNVGIVDLLRDRVIPPRFLPIARRIYCWLQRVITLPAIWVVPPGFMRIKRAIAFRRVCKLTAQESAILTRNSKFHNIYAGRRCFIIGTGPSLSRQDLTPLAGEITIAIGRFNMHPIIEKWKPTLYCMADPAVNIKRAGLSTFLDKIEAQAYFSQIGVKELFDEYKYVDTEKVYYLKMTAGQLACWPASKYPLDLTRALPGVWNTAQMALMIALYMGCSPIYLTGLDHNWLDHPSHGWAHFYPGPFDAIDVDKYNYKVRMEGVLNIWQGYEVLRDSAAQKGIAIYNATAGGFLDVFPRVEFESLFSTTST